MRPQFDRFITDGKIMEYVTDKRLSSKSYIRYMAIRLMKMFKYKNLPETIPHDMLEHMLLLNGSCFITKVGDKLYAFVGGFGGEPDVYYRPTRYTVANPALAYSSYNRIESEAPPENGYNWAVGSDGILVRNDSIWLGLLPLMSRYATLMAENVLTIRTAMIMLRITALISAPDDKTMLSAENYIRKLEKGELSIVAENSFFDGIKMQSPPSNNGSYLTQFIEMQQYLKGSFYNEIGLNANFNMKREAIGRDESSLNEDSLLPLCDDMLQCRKDDMQKVNELFSLNPPIEVEFDSAWIQNVLEMQYELEKMKNESTANPSRLNEEGDNVGEDTERDVENIQDTGESNNSDIESSGIVEDVIEEIIDRLEDASWLNEEEGDENAASDVE